MAVPRVVMYTDAAEVGGAERMLLTLARGLDRRQWDPVLLCHASRAMSSLAQAARDAGIDSYRVAAGPGEMLRLAGAIRELRPVILHAHLNWPLACRQAVASAIAAHVPAIVATIHLFSDVPWRRSRAVQRLLGLGVHRYICVSRATAESMRRTFGTPVEKISVIPNGVCAARFDVPPDPRARSELSSGTERPVALTCARLSEQKGLSDLVAAAAQAPGAAFAIAGEGPLRSTLEQQIRASALDSRVTLLGHRNDVPRLAASCDVAVLPSLREGLPLWILEAMAAGKPVVATDIPGTNELIRSDETGVLVPVGRPDLLAEAVHRVLNDGALARRLGDAGRAQVRERFTAAAMVERTGEAYRSVLQKRGVAA